MHTHIQSLAPNTYECSNPFKPPQVMHATGADWTNTWRRLARVPMPPAQPQPAAGTDAAAAAGEEGAAAAVAGHGQQAGANGGTSTSGERHCHGCGVFVCMVCHAFSRT